jgi:saccharopine dehydrogenase (NAD+, L-lysine-forming)
MNPEVYKKGRWTRSWSAMRAFDFGVGGGARQCTPWALQEMRDLPADIPSLRNAGFYIAGFSTLIDLVVMPAALLALRLAPSRRESIGRLFLASLRKWASRGEWAVLLLEGEGGTPRHRVRIRVAHRDPYDLTAAPIVACIEQLLDGSRRPGVFTQSSFVHPARFLHRLQGLGVSVQTLVSPVD